HGAYGDPGGLVTPVAAHHELLDDGGVGDDAPVEFDGGAGDRVAPSPFHPGWWAPSEVAGVAEHLRQMPPVELYGGHRGPPFSWGPGQFPPAGASALLGGLDGGAEQLGGRGAQAVAEAEQDQPGQGE